MVKSAVERKQILHCNRRGIVGLSSSSDKASLSVEELLENRRRGMSYASLGSKLGIDPSKDEVLNVFRVIREVIHLSLKERKLPLQTNIQHPSGICGRVKRTLLPRNVLQNLMAYSHFGFLLAYLAV